MAEQGSPETLLRWLLGGLAAGVVVLGIAVAAYAIGYHRGRHHRPTAAPAATTAAPTTSATTTQTTAPAATTTSAATTVAVTPALVARGKQLYTADACSGCHSQTNAPGAGPGFGGLAGSTVTLTTGQTVTADDAYLQESITSPDAQVVKGYQPIMAGAIGGFGLASKPDDVRALVAFIKSLKK
jgi:cytochrome c2